VGASVQRVALARAPRARSRELRSRAYAARTEIPIA